MLTKINIFIYFFALWIIPRLCLGFEPLTKRNIYIKPSTGAIKIDGNLNEPAWSRASRADQFQQTFPFDTSYSQSKTTVYLTYDDENLYISAICYDTIQGDYVIQSLKRDFSYPISDAFAVTIDPFNNQTTGFSFGVNPLGVQREGMIYYGGGQGVTTIWDNRWQSAVSINDSSWIVEMAIPFKTLRFKEDLTTWGINFSRNDLKRNESSTWCHVPRGFNIASLAYTGELVWDKPLKKTGNNVSIIPYMIGNVNRNYNTQSKERYSGNVGFDAKIGVTSSLNLDLTLNPDFSQVEVDRQQTNLTRFNLFYPEQRRFFLENSDIFERFGFRQIRPFFSRRIGLSNGRPVPIIAGARLSGRITEKWRTGIMTMQTAPKNDLNIEGQNYSVVALQRNLFRRSNIAGIFVNRQGVLDKKLNPLDFNRIVGLDYNLFSANNKWFGKFFYHQALLPNQPTNAYAHASFLLYQTPKLTAMWNHEYVGKNFQADAGFVPRIEQYNPITDRIEKNTYWRLEPSIRYAFYPKSKRINNHGPELYVDQYFNEDLITTDYRYLFNYSFKFQNTSFASLGSNVLFTKLLYPADITFTGKDQLLPAGNYHYKNILFQYNTSVRRKTGASFSFDLGEYFIGEKYSLYAGITHRWQPFGKFSLDVTTNHIELPAPYNNATLYLIGQRSEITFTKKLFLTTYLQYNTQAENFNVNMRFQWRFKPMSDLFIVYSDNYDTFDFATKNKALVVKFIYWLNY